MTPEKETKKKIRAWLEGRRAWVYMPVSMGYGAHGIPDFISVIPTVITPEMVGMTLGLGVAIEAKAPGKRENTSLLQKLQLYALHDAGAIAAVVADDNDLRELEVLVHAVSAGETGPCLPFERPLAGLKSDSASQAPKRRRATARRGTALPGRDEGTAEPGADGPGADIVLF